MTHYDDITVGDLMDEGRRYALEVGKHHEGNGFRAIIVFEDFPGYFVTGEPSNRPDAIFCGGRRTTSRMEAQELAYQHSEKYFGLTQADHRRIVMSSMGHRTVRNECG